MTYEELEQEVLRLKKSNSALSILLEKREEELQGYMDLVGSDQMDRLYLEAILTHLNLPIYLKDASYKYILVNHEYERLARITNDQIRGQDDFAIFPRPVARLFRDQDEEVVRHRSLMEFEETIPLPDGVRTFLTAKFPLIDSSGAVCAVGGVCTDITELKRTEALLRESKERFQRVVDNANEVVYRKSLLQGTFEFVSPASTIMFGYSPQEFYDSPELSSKIVHPDWREFFEKEWIALLAGKIPPDYEFQVIHKSGEVRWISLRNILIRDENGNPAAIEGIASDITERKLAIAILEQSRDELGKKVADRTVELDRKNQILLETNVALEVLLKKRDEDRKELEENVLFNIEKLILPYLEKAQERCKDKPLEAYLQIIKSNLDEITASFAPRHKDHRANLTQAQIQIADLIRQGKTTKEIAALLNLSPATIACHRQEIRKRLSLTNRKVNLQSVLAAKL